MRSCPARLAMWSARFWRFVASVAARAAFSLCTAVLSAATSLPRVLGSLQAGSCWRSSAEVPVDCEVGALARKRIFIRHTGGCQICGMLRMIAAGFGNFRRFDILAPL